MKNSQKKFGFLLIKKAVGPTSHDIVDRLRKITGISKIGHAGTLDPSAEGLLILGIGKKATKRLSEFLNLKKEYIAQIKLGEISSTFDIQGKIKKIKVKKIPKKEEVKKVLKTFLGEIKQIPPLYSAKKIKGKKFYQLARAGIKIKPKPIKIKIYKIKILKYSWPYLKMIISCSSGTYIRSLANDIGKKLNCGAYLAKLKRTKIGKFSIKKAKKISQVKKNNWKKFIFQKLDKI